MKKKIGVLASGRGTNLQAIIDACKDGTIPDAEVALVLSDSTDAYALERAKKDGIPTKVILREDFEKVKGFNMALGDALDEAGVDLVCLAGFMRILSKSFVKRFHGKCLNIHPSLLPSFPGLEGQQQAWDYGVKVSGCSVHYVDEGCDTGPVIVQRAVTVDEGCTLDELSAKILKEEHKAYPEAIKLHFAGRLTIEGRHVRIAPG
jgi:phosphoribosylglycinamide formyltransferase-1